MNRYKTETNGTLVAPAPMFASIWLALFYVLRENFNERRLAASAKTDDVQQKARK
jgi:hypothetical protein